MAGGHLNAQISCNRHFTTWGNPNQNYGMQWRACDEQSMRHTEDRDEVSELRDVKGCAIAIGYESDPRKLDPSSMVVISVDYQCPWFKAARFEIPAGLPPCPPEGCLCTWNWIHSAFGGQAEMMQTGFRCNVTGNTGLEPLPTKPKVASKCPYDRNNCTTGAKTPFVWFQDEGNNIHQDFIDPPYYNWEYGFKNGAQDDIFTVEADTYTNTEWAPIPWTTKDHPVPQVTPATKANVPPVQPTLQITPAPFNFEPGVSAPPNGPASRAWTGAPAQPTAEPAATQTPSSSAQASSGASAASAEATGSSSGPPSVSPTAAPTPTSPSEGSTGGEYWIGGDDEKGGDKQNAAAGASSSASASSAAQSASGSSASSAVSGSSASSATASSAASSAVQSGSVASSASASSAAQSGSAASSAVASSAASSAAGQPGTSTAPAPTTAPQPPTENKNTTGKKPKKCKPKSKRSKLEQHARRSRRRSH